MRDWVYWIPNLAVVCCDVRVCVCVCVCVCVRVSVCLSVCLSVCVFVSLTRCGGAGRAQEAGCEGLEPMCDLSTPQEKMLGRIVKEKYGTDFFMMDKCGGGARFE